jgi:hypothetical protein
MRLKKKIKQTKSAGKQSSVVRWGENQEEEASINNNDTADASINNEEDDNNMDIADSDDGKYLEQDIKCTQATSVPSLDSAKPKPL